MKFLNDIPLKCKTWGCPVRNLMIRFEELKEHTCKPLEATCPHDGCEAQITIDTKDAHWDQCPEVVIAC